MKHLNSETKARSRASAPPQESTGIYESREIELGLLLEPLNPARANFDEAKLYELIESIRAVGILQPLCVEREGKQFRVHAGHRRLIAARAIPLQTIPCRVFPPGALDGEAIKHHENKMREDLNAAEEARHFDALLESKCGGDVDRLCAMVMERREYVEERLILIHGDLRVFQALSDSVISIGVAKELNKVNDVARRIMYLDAAMQGGASVRMVRDWRVRGNAQDAMQHDGPSIELNNSEGFQKKTVVEQIHCYMCDSTEDTHEMEILYVHRSCARAARRMSELNERQSAAGDVTGNGPQS